MNNEFESKFLKLYNSIIFENEDTKDSKDLNNLVSEIISILQSEDLNLNEIFLKRIYTYSKRMLNGDEIIKNFKSALIDVLKLNKEWAEILGEELQYVVEDSTIFSLTEFLNDESKRLNIDDYVGRKISFIELMDATNLPEPDKLFQYLWNKELPQIPKMGKGEIFLAILFKSAQKAPGKRGDVQIKSDELEVKDASKNGARLGGQSGFGDQTLVADTFKSELIKNATSPELKFSIKNYSNRRF